MVRRIMSGTWLLRQGGHEVRHLGRGSTGNQGRTARGFVGGAPSLHRALRGLGATALALVFWGVNRALAEDPPEDRLVALRADQPTEDLTGLAHHLQQHHEASILYVPRDGEVHEVEIFLDERLQGELSHGDPATWRGLIGYTEDEIENA